MRLRDVSASSLARSSVVFVASGGVFTALGGLGTALDEPWLQIVGAAGLLFTAVAGSVITWRGQRAAHREENEAVAREEAAKPALTLELDPALERDGPTPKTVGRSQCVYYRLRVRNGEGRGRATDVHVEIEDIDSPNGSAPPTISALRGMWLAWSDRELTNPRAERTVEQVGPGSAVPLDLAHLNSSVRGKIILDVRPQPVGHPNHVAGATLSLTLAIHAGNADPRRFVIDLVYDGQPWAGWDENARDHLSVGNLRPVEPGN